MKRILVVGFLLISCFFLQAQNIPAKPNPPRLVNDFANILTPGQIEALEQKLVHYDDSTSTQIAIVTVTNLGGYAEEEYALKILRDWGVGNKKSNNGVVILAAIEDRKLRIEVGYGLEGAIPDITAKQIIENELSPHFRRGEYYEGFDRAADALIKAAAGEYKAVVKTRRGRGTGGGGSIIGIVIIFIIILIVLSRIGGGGGRGGGMINRGGILPWILLNSMLNSGRGGSSGWSGGGGGGGWSGGGGGGFGGFGGGGGGGGGASGSW
jgi:uncharacterized protein